ncbi:MAG: 50S ribosomal protein L22 [Candidatus Diapherotrites archaeon]|nr:50S ribosomal protein L22 [Candidatus Diapherotrites archaeon]
MKRYYNLQTKDGLEKKLARAMSVGVRASLKFSTEICNQIKGKPVKKAEAFLERVLTKESYLPLTRYNTKVGHRKGESHSGVKSGRFATNTVKIVLKLLKSAMSNADFKGLDADKLLVHHAFACDAFGRPSSQNKGKIGGKQREQKACHIEIVLMEAA